MEPSLSSCSRNKIIPSKSRKIVWKSYGAITLEKQNREYLTKLTETKHRNLSIDIDKYKSESDLENEEAPDKMRDYVQTSVRKVKQERLLLKFYLTGYNSLMFILYFSILLINVIGLITSDEYHPTFYTLKLFPSYLATGYLMNLVIGLSFLESLHSLLKISSANFLASLYFNLTKGALQYWIYKSNPQYQSEVIVTYLYIIWCLAESIRYPYFILVILKQREAQLTKILQFLRYHNFMLLLPINGLLELGTMQLVFRPNYQQDDSIIPGIYHKTINVVTILGTFINYQYMMRQRNKRYSKNKDQEHLERRRGKKTE